MGIIWQCIEDLSTIARVVDLPHGRDIATRIFNELRPLLAEIRTLKERDRTGAILQVLRFAEDVRVKLDLDGEPLLARDSRRD